MELVRVRVHLFSMSATSSAALHLGCHIQRSPIVSLCVITSCRATLKSRLISTAWATPHNCQSIFTCRTLYPKRCKLMINRLMTDRTGQLNWFGVVEVNAAMSLFVPYVGKVARTVELVYGILLSYSPALHGMAVLKV
ncbi:MAG: hypothetical protein JWP44_4419 [Mucilaginibacter sp.]|nr:hypothetical protein [Mucilaginibacter sp.]